jgi:endonuclease YncB( thermonuclease family)
MSSSPMRLFRSLPLTLAAAVAGAALTVSLARAEISGEPEIVDGDTFDIGFVRIRLHGVDAPENGQRCAKAGGGDWDCGAAAAARVSDLADEGSLICTGRERDLYGRVVASCEAGGVDVGQALVREGLAWAYLEYSDDYADDERAARAEGLGIWQADTETAWDFRADRWQRAAAAAPRVNCPIKGNISAKGEHIYHTPWSKYYTRTRIDESAGEAWFCDEAEAEAAGWRPAAGR